VILKSHPSNCAGKPLLGLQCAIGATPLPASRVTWPMHMSRVPQVLPLFATPLIVYDVPDSAALNVELRRVIEEREKTHPTTRKSNMGGWQSSWDMDRWGGVAAIKLLAYGAQRRQPDDDRPAGRRRTGALSRPLRGDLDRQHVGEHQPHRGCQRIPFPSRVLLVGH
jgi:hypothetical protein